MTFLREWGTNRRFPFVGFSFSNNHLLSAKVKKKKKLRRLMNKLITNILSIKFSVITSVYIFKIGYQNR